MLALAEEGGFEAVGVGVGQFVDDVETVGSDCEVALAVEAEHGGDHVGAAGGVCGSNVAEVGACDGDGSVARVKEQVRRQVGFFVVGVEANVEVFGEGFALDEGRGQAACGCCCDLVEVADGVGGFVADFWIGVVEEGDQQVGAQVRFLGERVGDASSCGGGQGCWVRGDRWVC